MTLETPTFDTVRLDLGIDPADLVGHEIRMIHLIDKHRSKMIDKAGQYTPAFHRAYQRATAPTPHKKKGGRP